jgi:hypothetical protein
MNPDKIPLLAKAVMAGAAALSRELGHQLPGPVEERADALIHAGSPGSE